MARARKSQVRLFWWWIFYVWRKGGGDQVIGDKNQCYPGVETKLYLIPWVVNPLSLSRMCWNIKKFKTEIIEIERDFVIALCLFVKFQSSNICRKWNHLCVHSIISIIILTSLISAVCCSWSSLLHCMWSERIFWISSNAEEKCWEQLKYSKKLSIFIFATLNGVNFTVFCSLLTQENVCEECNKKRCTNFYISFVFLQHWTQFI